MTCGRGGMAGFERRRDGLREGARFLCRRLQTPLKFTIGGQHAERGHAKHAADDAVPEEVPAECGGIAGKLQGRGFFLDLGGSGIDGPCATGLAPPCGIWIE